MDTNKKICCICKKEFFGYGNNPQPVKQDGECCNECNRLVCMIRLELSVKDIGVLR